MSDRPRSRQDLYDRIRASSKDEVILEDMIRLGFWPARGEVPGDPADEVRRKGDLERQIAALRTEQARLHNIDAIRKEMRKRRLDASKEKQKETKERHERERIERAAQWKLRKAKEILFLGEGVSGGLRKGAPANPERLGTLGLPKLDTAADVANAMGISVGELRFLAYERRTANKSHYVRFQLPKKTGGTRLISAPMPRLKKAQRWILDEILAKVTVEEPAHGFRAGRSIVSNAVPHVATPVVVNIDLKDFFPTVTFRRIKGVFRSLGYGEETATILALLTSEPEVDEIELDGVSYFVAHGARRLPQGSPASPAITNVLCRRMDRRIAGLAKAMGFAYTRYADDLSFSGTGDLGKLLRAVRFLVDKEGFAPHEKKTRVLRRGRRQEVTGVVVNEKPSIERANVRRLRALLFQLDKDGPTGKRWNDREGEAVFASAIGYASYITMVDPARGMPLLTKARAVAAKWGHRPPPPPPRGGAGGGGGGAPPIAPTPAPEPPKPVEPPKKKWKLF